MDFRDAKSNRLGPTNLAFLRRASLKTTLRRGNRRNLWAGPWFTTDWGTSFLILAHPRCTTRTIVDCKKLSLAWTSCGTPISFGTASFFLSLQQLAFGSLLGWNSDLKLWIVTMRPMPQYIHNNIQNGSLTQLLR